MSKTPEGKIKDKVKTLLKQHKVYYFMPVQTGMGMPGVDFHCCYNGQALFIETKAPGKKLTPRQAVTVAAIRAAGGHFFLVYDSDSLDHVNDWIHSNHLKTPI